MGEGGLDGHAGIQQCVLDPFVQLGKGPLQGVCGDCWVGGGGGVGGWGWGGGGDCTTDRASVLMPIWIQSYLPSLLPRVSDFIPEMAYADCRFIASLSWGPSMGSFMGSSMVGFYGGLLS